MELKSSKLLRRTSKKGPKKEPMSQQRRQRGGRRHIRKQRRSLRGPMETPNGAAEAAWRRTTSEHGSNMGSKRYPKRVQMRGPATRELRSAPERAPQMEPENLLAHGKHKNEARGVLRSFTWAPDGAPRGQNGDVTPMGEPEVRTLRGLAKPVI